MNSGEIIFLIQLIISFLPFVLFAFLNSKANMKKEIRNRQFFMVPFALIYSIALIIFLSRISALLTSLFLKLSGLFNMIGLFVVGDFIYGIHASWGIYLSTILFNIAALALFVIVKRALTASLSTIVIDPNSLLGSIMDIFYTYDEEDERWYIKPHYGQARTFIKSVYFGGSFIAGVALFVSFALCMLHLVSAPFYPVFAVIIIGEIAFFIDGLEKGEQKSSLSIKADKAMHIAMYPLLRKPLKALFGDKLSAEGTTVNNVGISGGGIEDILVNLEKSGSHVGANYAAFIRKKMTYGLKPNVDYVKSGYELATGKSLLFNTPFYDKLNPYVFYAMNRALLTGGKVMIVLGRHGTEDDLHQWCRNGMKQVSNISDLWKISVLTDKKVEEDEIPDIGIVSRSSVHDLNLQKNNLDFLKEVSFVMVVEPSRLVTTAQIGLNMLVKNCGQDHPITFCSMDRNCDGLVDALSHILMTNITEVSATEYPHGISSFMYWTADSDYLQHRIVPGVSRFLGMGTELSMVALKNQVKETVWYGGDSFPVQDARWIAKQYYYDLLDYAQLPTTQETFDNCFKTSFNMCNEQVKNYSYITVEDERNNLFETRRNFATIAEQQGFVNVVSSEYMLREYMANNTDVFTADAKAIPYITADYARTKRNVILTICLLLCVDSMQEEVLRRHLMLLNLKTDDLSAQLWQEICVLFCEKGAQKTDNRSNAILSIKRDDGKTLQLTKEETIVYKREYSVESGQFESVYTIENEAFARIILDDLQNATYIAEQDSRDVYIGTELKGHVYQKYMPGQFFTLNGKYYEMVATTGDDRIMVRRAADHITGRLSYRQVRNYNITHLEDAQSMGALKTVNDIDIHYQFADFTVETPGYWKMSAYNDFDNGALVLVNGVPTRRYKHKQILKFDFSKFGEAFTDSIRMTLTNLLNETFVTMFAENQPFISAITPGCFDAPITYNLSLEEEIENADKCIFIIEDSQLDIGLLIAVERNINRIFQIISDYLAWNDEMIEESLKEPEEEQEPEVIEEITTESEPTKKKNIFARIWDWCKGLFKKKKGPDDLDVPAVDYKMIYGRPFKKVNGKWVKCSQEEFDKKMGHRHDVLDENALREKERKAVEKANAAAEKEAQQGIAVETEVIEIEDDSQQTEAGEDAALVDGVSVETLSPKEQRKAAKAAKKEAKKAEKEAKKAAKAAKKEKQNDPAPVQTEEITQQPEESEVDEPQTQSDEQIVEAEQQETVENAEETPEEEALEQEEASQEEPSAEEDSEGEVSDDE